MQKLAPDAGGAASRALAQGSKPKKRGHHVNPNTDQIATEPDRREKGPGAAAAFRRRAAVRKNGAGEQPPRLGVDGVAAAIKDGRRWPDRQPSGQGLGVDCDRPVRTWRG